MGDALGNCQPEPGATVLAGIRCVSLLEGFEQGRQFFGMDSDAGIHDLDTQTQLILRFLVYAGTQGDLPVIRIFDRVDGVVEQRLAQSGCITMQPERHLLQIDDHWQAFLSRMIDDHGADIFKHRGQREIRFLEHHLAGFDLGKVENVVDDRQQVGRRAFDLVQTVELAGCGFTVAQQVSQADDGVHRGADFVTHVGQERALGDVGCFSLQACFGQLRGALGDDLLQVIPIAFQFFLHRLGEGNVFLDRDEVRDWPIVLANRCEHGKHRAQAAILVPVDELAVPSFAALQRLPQFGIGCFGGAPGFE